MLYFSNTVICSSRLREFTYFFHPGQNRIWNRHSRPKNDFGFASYFALNPQLLQLCSAIYVLLLVKCLYQSKVLNNHILLIFMYDRQGQRNIQANNIEVLSQQILNYYIALYESQSKEAAMFLIFSLNLRRIYIIFIYCDKINFE
jgi:hypothetical protein